MPHHAALIEKAEAPAKLYLFTKDMWEVEAEASSLPEPLTALAKANGFKGQLGQFVLRADESGQIVDLVGGIGDGQDGLAVAALAAKLPTADYELSGEAPLPLALVAAGWTDGTYRFDRYLKQKAEPPRLVIGADKAADAITRQAVAIDPEAFGNGVAVLLEDA